ncbi:MAG: hypothetical protein GC190_15905 [Alphaproteobacteria bacterium]|nr:hypothetical protein [Alphaproteobacteria bacterium]
MIGHIALFLIAAVIMCAASIVFTTSLERIGVALRFPEALLGLTVALGADAPELSSAVASLSLGHHDVSIGVVLGSNIFNLAGLLGLSAIAVGRIDIGRAGLLLNGGVGLLVTVLALALVVGWSPPWAASTAIIFVFVPYAVLSSLRSSRIKRLPLSKSVRSFLQTAVDQAHRDTRRRRRVPSLRWLDIAFAVGSIVVLVASCETMVRMAVLLGDAWSLSHIAVGYVGLAVVTSIPNAIAAVKLATDGRGVAVVSETLNSNTINILGGICLTSLVYGQFEVPQTVTISSLWLIGMTAFAMVSAAATRRGLSRDSGILLVLLYLAYLAAIFLF